jgi:glycosyltransferase involved in cell wall biosynthesis
MNKTKKILFAGRLVIDNTPCAGEVVKNQLLLRRLKNVFVNVREINLTPLTRISRKPILYLMLLWNIIKGVDCFFVSTFDELAEDIISFLRKFGKSSNIYYWVIGGGFAKRITFGELNIENYKGLAQIIVEDIDIENELRKHGVLEVSTVPNFKPVLSISPCEKKKQNSFLYLARITPLKGCDIILSAARTLNRRGLKFTIDFYGFIEKGYPFEEYIADIPNVNFKGTLSLKSEEDYERLYNNYDALLFPTYYPNEGFPGTIIDGYMAGLPVITTQWRYNQHIVEDKKSGWLIPVQDSDSLAVLMEEIISGKYNLDDIGLYNLKKVRQYDVDALLNDDFFFRLGLI